VTVRDLSVGLVPSRSSSSGDETGGSQLHDPPVERSSQMSRLTGGQHDRNGSKVRTDGTVSTPGSKVEEVIERAYQASISLVVAEEMCSRRAWSEVSSFGGPSARMLWSVLST
jgi:hypothetical protein